MTDLAHQWGGDLAFSPAGDMATVSGSKEGQQRVLRRILTISGNYIWELNYGGGAPALVGSLSTPQQVEATMRAQMLLEDAVSQLPPPVVNVAAIPGGLSVSIRYVDAKTGDPVTLAFSAT